MPLAQHPSGGSDNDVSDFRGCEAPTEEEKDSKECVLRVLVQLPVLHSSNSQESEGACPQSRWRSLLLASLALEDTSILKRKVLDEGRVGKRDAYATRRLVRWVSPGE